MAESPQSQQSWAAWILDAYANSIIPATSEESQYEDGEDSAYESMSPSSATTGDPTLTTTNDAASAYGPYVRTGRGGSGNYTWDTAPSVSGDVEAQRPRAGSLREKRRAAANVEHIDTSAAVRNSKLRQSSQYVRVGRGGAGNIPFVQSNEIQRSPASATYPKSPLSGSSSTSHTGRGGAGNFAASRSASESAKTLKEKEEQEKADQRREDAERQVGEILRPPTQAWLGGRRRSWLPTEEEE